MPETALEMCVFDRTILDLDCTIPHYKVFLPELHSLYIYTHKEDYDQHDH